MAHSASQATSRVPGGVTQKDKANAFRYFEAISGFYEGFSASGPLRLLREKEHASVLRLAELTPPARSVIDVGCGAGFYSICARSAGLETWAVDACQGMVDRVKPFVDQAIREDLENLRLDRTFDVVIAAGVLDFVSDPGRSLEILAKLTAPGGRLVIQVPVSGWASHFYRLEKRIFGIRVNVFSEEWFVQASRKMGLVFSALERPLPFNFTLLFRRPVE